MTPLPSSVFLCPLCDYGKVLTETVLEVNCPRCDLSSEYPDGFLLTASTWDLEETPISLLRGLQVLGLQPSPRKARLVCVSVARVRFAWLTDKPFWEAIDAAGEWAEMGRTGHNAEDLRGRFRRRVNLYTSAETDWRNLWLDCLADEAKPNFAHYFNETLRYFADAYRDFVPNPFIPLEWNSEWITSTVRDLASHIYTERKFELMPILGDALMDAGCDHELILDHCCTNKPHARGCWVVDAVLGKT
jgi:hypothetical protein